MTRGFLSSSMLSVTKVFLGEGGLSLKLDPEMQFRASNLKIVLRKVIRTAIVVPMKTRKQLRTGSQLP
jgi:hypothetical protein